MRSPPEDSWNAAYVIFFLQGIGQLFPWNVFINAEDYYRRRLCGSFFENNFENWFSVGYNLSAIVGLLLALRYQELWDLTGRIMGSLVVSLLIFVACGIVVLVEELSSKILFFWTMCLILLSGFSTAILQGGLFSMASAFPPRYTQAMMAGQGLAGLAVALAGLFTTLAGPDDQSCIVDLGSTTSPARTTSTSDGSDEFADSFRERQTRYSSAGNDNLLESSCAAYTRDWSTLVYFGVAVIVLLGCMLTYPCLQRLPLTAFYSRTSASVGGDCDEDVATAKRIGVGIADEGARIDDGWLGVGRAAVSSSSSSSPTGSSMYRRLVETPPLQLGHPDNPPSDSTVYVKGEAGDEASKRDSAVVVNGGSFTGDTTALDGLRSRLAPIGRYAFAVFMVFTVTLSVFPGATSEIVSSRECEPGRSRFFAGDVFVMFSFVSFNAFDLLGRLSAGLALVLPNGWLRIASVSRLVFVLLFLACRSENSRFGNWLSADMFPLILMPLFAFTNGYVGSLSMMAGSQKGAWAGTAMVLFLNGGLLAGSLLSFVVLLVSTES
ncbi:unnamed protein product [Scytosiphon promiscuus]